MRYKPYLLILALYVLMSPSAPAVAIPASPPDPEEAYRIHIKLDKHDLPPGVRLTEKLNTVRDNNSPYRLSTACIYGFINETDKPFYIIDPAGSGNQELSNVPEKYRPIAKFVSGNTYDYHEYARDDGGWDLAGPSTEALRSFDLIDLSRMGNTNIDTRSWGCSFAALSSRDYTGKYKDILWLNTKHNITVTAYYEGELRPIHGKIWFTRYDPRSFTQRITDGVASYISFTEAHPFKAQAWILIFAGATYLVAHWLSRRYQLD